MSHKEQFIKVLDGVDIHPAFRDLILYAATQWAEGNATPTPLTIMEQQNPDCPLHGCHVAGEHHKVKVKVFGEVEHANYFNGDKVPFPHATPEQWNKYTAVAEVCKSHNVAVSENDGVLIVEPIKIDKV